MFRYARLACSVIAAIGATLALCSSALALGGAQPLITKGSTPIGAEQGTASALLTLAPRDASGLQALVAQGTTITPAEFKSGYAPSASTVAAIERWARGRA